MYAEVSILFFSFECPAPQNINLIFIAKDYFNDMDMHRDTRVPRLRYGRRSDIPAWTEQEASDNDYDMQTEKRKPVRLRWGRSYKSGSEDVSVHLINKLSKYV